MNNITRMRQVQTLTWNKNEVRSSKAKLARPWPRTLSLIKRNRDNRDQPRSQEAKAVASVEVSAPTIHLLKVSIPSNSQWMQTLSLRMLTQPQTQIWIPYLVTVVNLSAMLSSNTKIATTISPEWFSLSPSSQMNYGLPSNQLWQTTSTNSSTKIGSISHWFKVSKRIELLHSSAILKTLRTRR